MAIDATMVWEVRANGSINNGGGFKPGASGTDFSQQDSAQYALTSVTTSEAGDTFLTASAATNMVGNVCKIVSGTNFTAGWYEIIAVSVGTSVQVDRACCTGAGSNGVINIGGAFVFEDACFEAMVAGNTMWVKADAGYTLTASINYSVSGTLTSAINILGYKTTRGDNPKGTNRPTITCGANVIITGDYFNIQNFSVNGTGSYVWRQGSYNFWRNMEGVNSSETSNRAVFSTVGSLSHYMGCEAESTNGYAFNINNSFLTWCYAHDSVSGLLGSSMRIVGCIFDSCTNGVLLNGNGVYVTTSTFYNCGKGIDMVTYYQGFINSNIFASCTTGVSASDLNNSRRSWSDGNNWYNNTADTSNFYKGSNEYALDPQFVDASNGDFRTGTNMKVLTIPGTATGLASSNSQYLGAINQSTGGSAGSAIKVNVL